MARILMIHIRYPEADRCSGDLRLTNFLRILAERHEVNLHILHKRDDYVMAPENQGYRATLQAAGIGISCGSLTAHLRNARYDAVVIEFWYVAKDLIEVLRQWQPHARIIVDTEHLYFYSDLHKAKVLGQDIDGPEFRARKAAELDAYARADAVLAVTGEDRDVLLAENPTLIVGVVPNIHDIPDVPAEAEAGRVPGRILFVGNFANNPSNVDSMTWFVHDILPLVQARVPEAHLQIVGNAPPPEVLALAGPGVEVTGYVPETAPYLLASQVSICPLRFGAGLKGKIGEAMMYQLPVVTTDIGAQGMEVAHGEGIMLGNSPEAFAQCIVDLLSDAGLRRRVAQGGFDYLRNRYSYAAGQRQVNAFFDRLDGLPLHAMPRAQRLLARVNATARQYLAWRLR